MSRVAFTQGPTVVRVWTAEFMSFGASAGGPPTLAHMRAQANDWDLVCPNAFAGGPYSAAVMIEMRSATYRDPARGPLYFVGYGNDGAVLVNKEPGSPTDLVSDRPYNQNHYAYKASRAGITPPTGAERLADVSRVPSSNYVAAVWKNDYIDQHIAYYKAKLERTGSDPDYDATMVDVMGPFPAQDHMDPKPWNPLHPSDTTVGGFTVEEWLTYTANMTAKMHQGGVVAGSQWVGPAPAMPNGVVNGLSYKSVAAGGLNTRRLPLAGGGGMVELFVKGEYWDDLAQVTNTVIENNADMLIDAEAQGKVLLCVSKLWVDQGANDAARLAYCKEWFRYCFAIWLLGANGRSFFSFRDDRPAEDGGTHRTLNYPAGVGDTGTPTTGRRRQFQMQFFGTNDRWYDKARALGPGTNAYEKNVLGFSGLYRRVFQGNATYPGGVVYVNNSGASRTITTPTGAHTDIDGTTYTSAQSVSMGNKTVLILTKDAAGPAFTYQTSAATSVTHNSATLNASTDDLTGTTKTGFSIEGAAELAGTGGTVSGGFKPWTRNVTGLTPSTTYDYTVYFRDNANNLRGSATSTFTTSAAPVDGTPPTVPGSVVATQDAGGVLVTHTASTDADSGVKEYRYWRQNTVTESPPGTLVETVPAPSTSWHDDDVAPGNYVYGVDATDNATNTSALGSASAVTITDTGDPVFPLHARITYAASPSQIQLWAPAATDDVGVDKYTWTRTGGGGGPVATEVSGSADPVLVDATVAGGASYRYDLVAVDGEGNTSTVLTVYVTAVAAATGAAMGPPGL